MPPDAAAHAGSSSTSSCSSSSSARDAGDLAARCGVRARPPSSCFGDGTGESVSGVCPRLFMPGRKGPDLRCGIAPKVESARGSSSLEGQDGRLTRVWGRRGQGTHRIHRCVRGKSAGGRSCGAPWHWPGWAGSTCREPSLGRHRTKKDSASTLRYPLPCKSSRARFSTDCSDQVSARDPGRPPGRSQRAGSCRKLLTCILATYETDSH